MEKLFDSETYTQTIDRINNLSPGLSTQWGK